MRRLGVVIVGMAGFALGCGGDGLGGEGIGGGGGGGGGGVIDNTVPVVFSVSRDAEGQTTDDGLDESELCPAGSEYLGGNGYAAACLDEGIKGVAAMIGNADRQYWPDDVDSEAEICPPGTTHVGGNGYYATCVQGEAMGSYEIFFGPNGEDVEDVGLGACAGEGIGYGYYGSAVCKVEGQRPTVLVANKPDGTAYDEVDDPAEMCASGWDFVGTSWYGTPVCMGPEGTAYYVTRDAQGNTTDDVDEAGELCPDGAEWMGNYYGSPYCFEATPRTVAYLSRNAAGDTSDDVDEAELCPDGWEHVGGSSYAAVCRR